MDSQQQQQQHAHMANSAAWQVPPHAGYMMAAPQIPHTQATQQQHQAYQQAYQHPAMMEQQHHPLSHISHAPAPPVAPSHTQGYGMSPHEPPRGGSSGGRRSPPPYRGSYRDRSFSPPPRHRRTPSPRGYRDSRGYNRDVDYRGYDRGYDRGYERSDRGYDRGHGGREYDRGYDRGYDRDYDRGYGRSGQDRGHGHRARSPPKRSRTVNRGTEDDRLASKTLYVGNIPYSYRETEIEDMFKKFGTIVKVTVVLDQYTGRNKGFAFVEFEDRKNAEEAMEQLSGFGVEGRRLKLDWDIGLNKKDIKPSRSAGATAEGSTAEASPQPQTTGTTEASSPVEGEVQDSSDPAAVAASEQTAQLESEHSQTVQQPDQSTEQSQDHNTEAGNESVVQQPAVEHQEQQHQQDDQQTEQPSEESTQIPAGP